jgi:hypothetical protein
MNTLSVYYVSQIMTGALEHNNDCGAASSLMLLGTYNLAKDITVDKFYNSIVPAGDTALSVGSIQTKMASYGLQTDWKVDNNIETLFYYLRNHKPALALIHYAPLVDAGVTEKKGFRGAHFIVVTGIDLENVYINDPYRTDGKINVAVPIAVFESAWKQCSLDGNPTGGCIVPKLPIQDLAVVIPPTNDGYYLLVNGLNVRSGPSNTYPLVRTIWKANEPLIHALTASISNDYIRLTDLSGWVCLRYNGVYYLKKQ